MGLYLGQCSFCKFSRSDKVSSQPRQRRSRKLRKETRNHNRDRDRLCFDHDNDQDYDYEEEVSHKNSKIMGTDFNSLHVL